MSLRDLERGIINEINNLTGRRLRLKDLLEWSTSEGIVRDGLQEGEEAIWCPLSSVWAAIPTVKK